MPPAVQAVSATGSLTFSRPSFADISMDYLPASEVLNLIPPVEALLGPITDPDDGRGESAFKFGKAAGCGSQAVARQSAAHW